MHFTKGRNSSTWGWGRESYEENGPRDSPLPQQQTSQVTTGSPLYLPGSHTQASRMESSLSVSRRSGPLTRSPKPMTTCQFGACVYGYSFLRSYNPLCSIYQIPESVHKKRGKVLLKWSPFFGVWLEGPGVLISKAVENKINPSTEPENSIFHKLRWNTETIKETASILGYIQS